jgi:hypothetical protein
VLDLKRAAMSAQIIRLSRAENGETPAPLRPPSQPSFRAALTGALRRYWRRTRLIVEGFGWLCAAATVFAAIRG